jgi:hypothetical protein
MTNNTLFVSFHAFLLLFIFLAGGVNKFIHFQDMVKSLESQISTIQLSPVFILAIIATILYFYVILNVQIYNKNKNLCFFLMTLISITILGIPSLVYFKDFLRNNKNLVSLIYNTSISGVILLLFFGSLLVLYSLFTSTCQDIAYVATIGLATFTAMTILIYHFPTNKDEVTSFTKNLSIFGGLMLLSQQFVKQ